MPPKKDKKKGKDEPVVPEFVTAYLPREPQPQPEAPDVSEADVAWKAARNQYVLPLPEWNADAADIIAWKPNEVETPFVSDQFSVKALPRPFMNVVSGWRRAGAAALAKGDLLPEEAEPQAQPLKEIVEEPPEPEDPKAKAKAKADAKAKAKAKGAPVEEPPENPSTMQQYADCEYHGEARVVTQQEFRSRELQLDLDDAAPQLSQAIAAQFAAVAEHKLLIPKGFYLWELIYPQDDEGMPLYNPHGKYTIKLFVQGRWRMVLIDDVMPVGHAIQGSSVFAPVMPASTNVNVIWPQLLAKGLLVAFQDDLSAAVLPVIQALTGWTPYQLPLAWQAATGLHSVRTFCTLKMNSQVDLEGRNRAVDQMPLQEQVDPRARGAKPAAQPSAPGIPAVPSLNLSGGSQQPAPKLGNQPSEALLEFLVCELEEEPRQVRLKAGTALPLHGTPRKLTREVESEEEDASADEATNEDAARQQPRAEHDDVEDSDREDMEEDEEDRRSQNSPSGDAANGVQGSARSNKEGGSQAEGGEGEGEGGEEGQEGEAEEDLTPWVAPWPDENPAPMMMKSVLQDFQSQLSGGFWVSYEEVEANATSLCSYIPSGDHMLSGLLDTRWNAERKEAYTIPPVRLLRVNLVANELRPDDHGTSKKNSLSPWFPTVITYEPLRISPLFGEMPTQPAPVNCVLQAVNEWRSSKSKNKASKAGPDRIHFTVGDTPAPFVGSTSQSLLLPPGEHWYLVLDDASSLSGSTLSVSVEGLLSNINKSSIEFDEPNKFLEDCGISVVTVGPMEYPIHHGYKVWTKAEVTISAEAGDVSALQLLCHVSDVSLWPYLQLSCLRMTTSQDEEEPENGRCASWSAATLLKSPLLRVMSVPLAGPSGLLPDLKASAAGGATTKFVLMLDGNIPKEVLAKSTGTFSLQLFLPPNKPDVSTDFDGEFSSSESGEDEKAGEKEKEAKDEEGPLHLELLTVNQTLTWTGECAPNDKDLVLCERFTVPNRPEGAETPGDVTSTLRIQVHGLPQAYLKATLIAQMPPTEEMRPNMPDGTRPEPLVRGAGPINPRDYGGRRNWLSRCKVVAETSGLEVISFPHVLLVESSTYLLYVHLDTFRGPNALEGGTWQIDSFGSGPIEVGADSMEKDLEELVRRSWAEAFPQVEGAPPREEVAKAAREGWLAKQSGYTGEGEEAAEETGPTEEQLELEAALQRAKEGVHPNVTISSFLHGHAVEPAVLVVEDPYTVAPDRSEPVPPDFPPPPPPAAEDTDGPDGAETAPAPVFPDDPEAEDTEAACGINAFGTLGERKARIIDIQSSSDRWTKTRTDLEAAKERNANQIQEMRAWREDFSNAPGGAPAASFADQRDSIRSNLMGRMQKCANLKQVASDPERVDPEPLKAAIAEAEESGAGNWDVELMQTANCKLAVLEGSKSFLEVLESATTKVEAAKAAAAQVREAEPGAENEIELKEAASFALEEAETAAEGLEKVLKALKASLKEAAAKKIPVPEEIKVEEPFQKADALLEDMAVLKKGPEEAES
mmetsp:Transcript_5390/g.9627  ORF Transcript_5390/g.9627 Transcript_5390/m.9627 type:complete len:1525 (+) Transcript_5390:83-4657(+)